jgi:hypothetical protein
MNELHFVGAKWTNLAAIFDKVLNEYPAVLNENCLLPMLIVDLISYHLISFIEKLYHWRILSQFIMVKNYKILCFYYFFVT